MKIWFVGDIHFGDHTNSADWLLRQVRMFDKFIGSTINIGDPVVFMGDIFDNRQAINVKVMDEAIDCIENFAKTNKVYIIAGNHDVYYVDNNDVTTLKLFRNNRDITVFTKSKEFEIYGIKFLAAPWCKDNTKIVDAINNSSEDVKVVLMHADVSGMAYDNGEEIKNGVDLDAITKNVFMISGHIHAMQKKKNLLYVGTPMQLDRGDMGKKKGIFCMDVEDKSIKSMAFYENKVSPRFKRADMYEVLNMSFLEAKTFFENSMVDLYIPASFSVKYPFSKITDFFSVNGIQSESIEYKGYDDGVTLSSITVVSSTIKGVANELLDEAQGDKDAMLSYFDSLYDRYNMTKK
jgi:DNA repair exonuclease SbcCD nuclease subunit